MHHELLFIEDLQLYSVLRGCSYGVGLAWLTRMIHLNKAYCAALINISQ